MVRVEGWVEGWFEARENSNFHLPHAMLCAGYSQASRGLTVDLMAIVGFVNTKHSSGAKVDFVKFRWDARPCTRQCHFSFEVSPNLLPSTVLG
jgi:hypothetical protein